MRVVRHRKPESFQQHVVPFLVQREAVHNVILGMASRYGASFPEDALFTHVEDDDGTVIAAAMRTPPFGAVLSMVGDRGAIPLLVDAFAAQYDTLPTVIGAAGDAQCYADLWQEKCGQSYSLKMQQGIYQLEKVKPVQNVLGECRPATARERELLVDWIIAFTKETWDNDKSRNESAEIVDRKLSGDLTDTIRLWWDKERPVSLAAATRPTPNGVSIGPVYTPPEYRSNGYASAVTAALSQELLDSGRKFCFLYADKANPTSNRIYQRIGYELVCDSTVFQFNDPF